MATRFKSVERLTSDVNQRFGRAFSFEINSIVLMKHLSIQLASRAALYTIACCCWSKSGQAPRKTHIFNSYRDLPIYRYTPDDKAWIPSWVGFLLPSFLPLSLPLSVSRLGSNSLLTFPTLPSFPQESSTSVSPLSGVSSSAPLSFSFPAPNSSSSSIWRCYRPVLLQVSVPAAFSLASLIVTIVPRQSCANFPSHFHVVNGIFVDECKRNAAWPDAVWLVRGCSWLHAFWMVDSEMRLISYASWFHRSIWKMYIKNFYPLK